MLPQPCFLNKTVMTAKIVTAWLCNFRIGISECVRETLDLPGWQIGLPVYRELRADDSEFVLHDTRYYLCSLDPDQVTAEELLR